MLTRKQLETITRLTTKPSRKRFEGIQSSTRTFIFIDGKLREVPTRTLQ